MNRLYSHMTLEEALSSLQPSAAEVQEVYNEYNEFVGYVTLDALSLAVHQGDVGRLVGDCITSEIHMEDIKQPPITHSDLESFFQSPLCRIVLDSLYDGVYITDGIGHTLLVNEAYQRITGIMKQEVQGVHMSYLIQQGIISISASLEAIHTKRPVTLMQTIRNERKIIVSATPVLSLDNEVMYVISSVRDITELLRMKHELDAQSFWHSSIPMEQPYPERLGLENLVTGQATLPLFRLADKVAKTDAKILLQGETGVGKSMIAKYIHSRSLRSNEIFMELNCGAIPEHLVEAELFGYEAGSFTGASRHGRIGILEKANRGTLFLDEIGDLPLELQVKLLKVVEENRFMRVGSTETRHVDVRIITATHRDLAALVQEGKFREDLYYRLNIVPFEVPPLRKRKEEIIPLLQMYLKQFNIKYGENKTITPECYEWLTSYHWPGNIRELANLIERLVVTTFHDSIEVRDLPPVMQQLFPISNPTSLKERVARLEASMIQEAMQRHGTTRAAAEALEISQSALVQKMKKYQI